ncbi:MAG: amino acid permease [Gammaproteobacteria bacterium]
MNTQLLGSILLIVGTTIGGGMLALPIATSQAGFFYSSLLLFGCWLVMTVCAMLILEVNLWLPRHTNLISMIKATLGKPAQAVAWVTYLLLLYSLIAAYIAGGSDFLKNLVSSHITLPSWLAAILFAGILGYIVFLGIRSIDIVNRSLMFIKLGSFILIVLFVMPHVTVDHLLGGEYQYLSASITVALTSFGFATIVPSLRTHFHDDLKQLRTAILIGSLIPLICYILWDITVMGVISREGENGLIAIMQSGRSTSEFVTQLSAILQRETITVFAKIFTSVCLATSFLGVSLSLTHFLADGLGLAKTKSLRNDLIICGLTFFPPLLIVLFYPGAFISALSYAGIYCVILLILLPALMAWSGRYRRNIANGYRVFGGKPLLISLIILSILIIGHSVWSIFI